AYIFIESNLERSPITTKYIVSRVYREYDAASAIKRFICQLRFLKFLEQESNFSTSHITLSMD
ncbi:MAG: hypothetical protein AAFY16_14555, partial [Cyanobacteria bacterium J06642_3]